MLEELVRAGVGVIYGADKDVFEESNLNRQNLAEHGNLGELKTEAARKRVRRINPAVDFFPIEKFLDKDGFEQAIKKCHLCLDALGGLTGRKELLQAAGSQNKRVVGAALAGKMGYVANIGPGIFGLEDFWSGPFGAEEILGCPVYSVAALASLQCAEALEVLCGRQGRLEDKVAVLDLSDYSLEKFSLT